jgi:peptidoglycan/LPS O-acetylase OafA/YrhL
VAAVSAKLGLWTLAPVAPILAMLAAAVIVSVLIYRFVERPILGALQRHFARPAVRLGS